ncbi:hypothetical protein RhiirA4_461888 [Rhizophagus irregularis]|uniref:Reverse transcriptase domain-containing protein n=1 Tax=Rhizophagus irregularis TaxID=588596 RepID=A0A2I1GJS4_9GLOM|nr:hypothetical protein RhiirA4_461888 [Rhizophagus irregularis]
MDISKVYDSVSSIMLEKNLERLKLPTKLINIVMDIINNRFNRVIVNKEVTDEYYVRDGLDQGEIWSPILWRCYRIEVRYNDQVMKKIDENLTLNTTAFMDDTILHTIILIILIIPSNSNVTITTDEQIMRIIINFINERNI